MAVGQSDGQRSESFAAELVGNAFGGLRAAAVGIGVESKIDGPGAATQLMELMRIELSAQATSYVSKSRLL